MQNAKLEPNEPKRVRNIVPMKLDEVQPPDHVDGLRMEQDGHLNHDYKKEIIIGNHEEFEQAGSDKKLVARLKIIFIKWASPYSSMLHDIGVKSVAEIYLFMIVLFCVFLFSQFSKGDCEAG